MSAMKQTTESWVGPWLRSIRISKRTTPSVIAAKLGIHSSNVVRRECGQAFSADALPAVLAAYGVTPAVFAAKLKEQTS